MKPTSTPKWKEQVLKVDEKPPCKHVFQFVEAGECKCRKCGLGLMGVIDLMNGRPV
jgi:hypothetical protein